MFARSTAIYVYVIASPAGYALWSRDEVGYSGANMLTPVNQPADLSVTTLQVF